MTPLIDPRELARRNNESAAVHRKYREVRRARKQSGIKSAPLEKVLDALDRLEAEHTARPTRAVGFFLPKRP